MYRKLEHLPNLDFFLRTLAILMVLVLHITANFDVPNLYYFTKVGKYGVELFFCLSGFLVGCLFFNEHSKFGDVNLKRFILRRISRTLPPYYIVLVPAFLSAYFVNKVKFNYAYLFFCQNFLQKIPYFKVSWSICVEEHFYLLLPFVLVLIYKIKNIVIKGVFILALVVLPVILRLVESNDSHSFGYFETASFFHFDSMILGVIASYCYTYKKMLYLKFIFLRYILVLLLVGIFYFAITFGGHTFFVFGKFLISLVFTLIILFMAINRQMNLSRSSIISKIAVSSYAIYLTHPLVINVINLILKRYSISINVYFMMFLLLFIILIVGYCFYFIIEKRLMVLREKIVAR